MPVGVKVKGYGLLNEYGEFDFIPEQTGSRRGQLKVLKETATYTISVTKEKVIVHQRIKKGKKINMINDFLNTENSILLDLKDYDI